MSLGSLITTGEENREYKYHQELARKYIGKWVKFINSAKIKEVCCPDYYLKDEFGIASILEDDSDHIDFSIPYGRVHGVNGKNTDWFYDGDQYTLSIFLTCKGGKSRWFYIPEN